MSQAVHLDPEGKRTYARLYVGNLAFNASEEDLRAKLSPIFRRIQLDKITIPRVNGLSKYCFIDISWARQAQMKPVDLCITLSGRVKVKSRPIYYCELQEKGNN